MSEVLTYKGYSTRVYYSAEDGVLHGKIEGISDLINFECENTSEVENAFQEAVDDYLAFCADVGKNPDKEYRGTFNIRISPATHKALDQEAREYGISLNQVIEMALDEHVSERRDYDTPDYQKSQSFRFFSPKLSEKNWSSKTGTNITEFEAYKQAREG